mgnify:CR=1 FL=1
MLDDPQIRTEVIALLRALRELLDALTAAAKRA